MMKIHIEEEIQKPVEHVWSIVHDTNYLGQWLEGFYSIEQIEGEEKGIGSKYKLVIANNGKEMEMIETVTEFEPYRLYSNSMDSEMMITNTTMKFMETASGTKIIVDSAFEPKGIIGNLLIRMGGHVIEEAYKKSYQRLKEVAERL